MNISRRGLLTWLWALTLTACARPPFDAPVFADTPERVGNIINPPQSLLTIDEIKQMIAQYNTFENQIGVEGGNAWNHPRFYDMVKSRIESGNVTQLSDIIREISRHEIDSAYFHNPQRGYSTYNTNLLDDPNIFYGDIGENPSIAKFEDTLYDSRINGQINLNSPDSLLQAGWYPVWQKNVGFVVKDQNGKLVFAYYKNGKLKYVAPCSPGRNSENRPDTSEEITYDETPANGLSFSEYRNLGHYFPDGEGGGPMPYAHALLFHGNKSRIYTHVGSKIDGSKLSHGCIRLPDWLAYILFYDGDTGANVYVMEDYILPPERVL